MTVGVDLAGNIARVRAQIAEPADRAGRDPSSIRLIAVTKTFAPERIREAYQCGLKDFGENRVQEFREKLPHLNLPGAVFHFIGRLQSNKVHPAMVFDWIQTVDSEHLAARLQNAAAQANKTVPILLEVKLSEEAAKTGVREADLAGLVAQVALLDRLDLRGLMTMPPYSEEPEGSRPYFRRLRELRDRLQESGFPQVRELSMGMTHDFPVAIEEGATMVRLGTAIFGPRTKTR